MIVTMKNFLIGEQRRCHDVGMVNYNMIVINCIGAYPLGDS